MMHRLEATTNPAIALQNAAELRRSQSSNPSTTASSSTAAGAAQQPAATYNFAEIFGAASDERGAAATATATATETATAAAPSSERFSAAIATATATVMEERPASTAATTSTETVAAAASGTASTTATATTAAATSDVTASGASSAGTGIQGLVSEIMNGTFQPTYVTNPAQLQETNPAGTDYMPNFYYASNQTADQLASILGGTVVQMPPFGQDQGWKEPVANFIQLPNGQTFNAADVAYYAKTSNAGPEQLTADITQTINQGSIWTNYYQNGGTFPTFAEGYVGPPIAGMTYQPNMIDTNGNVINPAMQTSVTQGA
jgi:hypothetical protein